MSAGPGVGTAIPGAAAAAAAAGAGTAATGAAAGARPGFRLPRPNWRSIGSGTKNFLGRVRQEGFTAKLAPFAVLEAGMIVHSIVSGATTKATEWHENFNGRESGYYGGAYYGGKLGAVKGFGGSVGGWLGFAIGGAVAGSVVPGLGTVAGFALGIAGSMVGATATDTLAEWLWEPGIRAEQHMKVAAMDSAMISRRVTFGGFYRDTEEAYTMRQIAVQEMAGSMMNARQYLGNESAFMHR